jgi:hypothetical protein
VKKRTAQRWEIKTHLEPLVHTANELFTELVIKGSDTPLNIFMPQNYSVMRKLTTTAAIYILGNYNPEATQVTITANNGFIPKGTFFKFASHSKIYMTTQDLNGNGILNFMPPLRVFTPTNNLITYKNILASFYLEPESIKGMVYVDGILMDVGEVSMVEAQ